MQHFAEEINQILDIFEKGYQKKEPTHFIEVWKVNSINKIERHDDPYPIEELTEQLKMTLKYNCTTIALFKIKLK